MAPGRPSQSEDNSQPATALPASGNETAGAVDARPIVYVVDDDVSLRRSISRLLASVGLDVQAFGSASEFLDLERDDRHCCLVCDVRLPAQSGLDLQERLNQRRDDLAIVFITGYGTVQLGVRAMRAGAIHFLEKPFEEQDLLDAVFQALDRDMRRRQAASERAVLLQRFATLTPRESAVLEHVVAGLPNKRIAALLGASEKTIKVHRGRVMEKMHAQSLADLVGIAAKILPQKTVAVNSSR